MTLMEVVNKLATDRYTEDGLKHIITAMACTDPDAFAEVERDLNRHMNKFPESRKRFLVEYAE